MASIRIPTIDLRKPDRQALIGACRQWGIFQLAGHSVPASSINDLRRASQQLFTLSAAEKQTITRSHENPWGYFDRELTKNVPDWKEIFDVGPAYGTSLPQWPKGLSSFRRALENYTAEVHALSLQVLGMIVDGLGMHEKQVIKAFEQHTSFLRLNHYPRCPDPAGADSPTLPASGRLGIGHHTDAGALTVLDQADVPGLQVLHDGVWHLVPPEPGTFTINIGDVVQVWSNDDYPAPLHRVIANQDHERYSTAYFLNPPADFTYAPALTTDVQSRPRYRPILWSEFRQRRATGDFANYGQEVQISDYRIN